jgi:mannan endo-1,4-beta-mannosidase
MASGEGPKTEPFRITPTLQESVGDWNENVLVGLDFVLAEMGKRNMKGVLCLNNFFYWSGGMAQYVSWFTGEKIPYPEEHSWDAYMRFSARFYTLPKATKLYNDLIEKLVSRKNTITNVSYVNDPTIMSWQLANEPREFGHDKKYFKWVKKSSDLIRQLDENHLICIGNEGILDNLVGSTYKKTAALKNINYLTVHLWPENWGWYAPKNPDESFETTRRKSIAYLEKNAEVSKMVLKPIVLEEFGLARDGGSYEANAEVNMRNKFYQFLYETTLGNSNSPYRGMNFWAIGGEGRPRQPETFWQAGDDYIGDPPHEKQGWYSVYFTDSSTFEWLKKVQK